MSKFLVSNIFKSIIVCISMYSIIPVPTIKWKNEYLKYVFYFFPLIGIIIGLAHAGLFILAKEINISSNLYAGLAISIAVILTGGIHFDGFMDLSDGIGSHRSLEERIKILKDPHVGSFAVIYSIIYFIIMYSVFIEIYSNYKINIFLLFISIFFIPRVIGMILVSIMKPMKKEGFLYSIQNNTNKNALLIISILYMIINLIIVSVIININILIVLIFVIIISIILLYVYFNKVFLGISGDMAGFTISIMEIVLLLVFAIYGAII